MISMALDAPSICATTPDLINELFGMGPTGFRTDEVEQNKFQKITMYKPSQIQEPSHLG